MMRISVGLPVIVAAVLAAVIVADRAVIWQEARRLHQLVRLAAAMSDFVHEQQGERGATSLHLASDRIEFGRELAALRQRTDAKAAVVAQLSAAIDPDSLPPALRDRQAGIDAAAAERPQVRARVDAAMIGREAALDYYTGINEAVIAQIAGLAQVAVDAEVAVDLMALSAFLSAKERAALERAIGAAGFARGGFSRETLTRLERLQAEQAMALAQFRALAPADRSALLDGLAGLHPVREAARLRTLIRAFPATGSLGGVTGPAFFAAKTAELDALKRIETDLVAGIRTGLVRRERESLTALWAVAAGAGLTLALTIFVSWYFLLTIRRSVGEVVASAGAMAEDLHHAAPGDIAAPEMRLIAQALDDLRRALAQRNREMELFVSAAAHDLRSPIGGIRKLAEFTLEDHGGALPEEVRENLEIVVGRTRRIETIVSALLTFAQLARRPVAAVPTDPRRLVDEVIDTADPPAGLRITVAGDPGVLDLDPAILTTICQNLVQNAIKHHDRADGRITVGLARDGAALRLTVEDDGPGVPPEYHAKIRQPFARMKSRDVVEGAGMGLAIVERVLDSVGGALVIESPVAGGRGFRAVVSIPVPDMGENSDA